MKRKLFLIGVLFAGFTTGQASCTIASMELDRESSLVLLGSAATAWFLSAWFKNPVKETPAQLKERLSLKDEYEKKSLKREHDWLTKQVKIRQEEVEAEKQKRALLEDQIKAKQIARADKIKEENESIKRAEEAQIQSIQREEEAQRKKAEEEIALVQKIETAKTEARLKAKQEIHDALWQRQKSWFEEEIQAKEQAWNQARINLEEQISILKQENNALQEENKTLRAELNSQQDTKEFSAYCMGKLNTVKNELSTTKDELTTTKALLRNTRTNLERTYAQLAETTQIINRLKETHAKEIAELKTEYCKDKAQLIDTYEGHIQSNLSPSRTNGYRANK